MAEGFARQLAPQSWRIESSGLEASQVDPLTVAVMSEVGVDISQQVSQALSDFQADGIYSGDLSLWLWCGSARSLESSSGLSRLAIRGSCRSDDRNLSRDSRSS